VRRLPGLGPADVVLMAYAAFAGLLFLLMGWKLDAPTHWAAFVAAYGAILALTYWVATKPRPEGGLLGFVREAYPLFHIGFLYWGLRYLALFFSDGYHDAAIAGVDQALFGESLAMTLCQRFPSMFVSETFHAGYASYWIMVPAASVALYLRGKKEGLRELVFSSLLVFFVCYLFFIFYPVQGPYFAFPRIAEPLSNGAAYRLVHAVLEDGASRGAPGGTTARSSPGSWSPSSCSRSGRSTAGSTTLSTRCAACCWRHSCSRSC